jgi:hypothetical protein
MSSIFYRADSVRREYLNSRSRSRLASTPQPVATPSHCPSSVTSSAECLPPSTTCSPSRLVTLSDKVLLNIFSYFLEVSPCHWPTLLHVCRKWRRIVFASQRTLHLRLFCAHGTPALKNLDCWPPLPIVVDYGGSPALDPPTPEEEDNVVAALGQSDRVRSISLTVTSSLLKRLSAIEVQFLELEDLVLLFQDSVRLNLPSAFQSGPRLRSLHSTRVSFPALIPLLYSSENLVDLQLHEVLNP